MNQRFFSIVATVLLLVPAVDVTPVQANYYEDRAAQEIALQEAIEREARIQARADELRRQDAEAFLALFKACWFVTKGAAKGTWFVAQNSAKLAWYFSRCTGQVVHGLAADRNELSRRLRLINQDDIVGLCGFFILAGAFGYALGSANAA